MNRLERVDVLRGELRPDWSKGRGFWMWGEKETQDWATKVKSKKKARIDTFYGRCETMEELIIYVFLKNWKQDYTLEP